MPYRKISRGPPELLRIIFEVADLVQLKNIDYTIDFGQEGTINSYYDGIYIVALKGYRDGHKVRKRYFIKWHTDPKKRCMFHNVYRREYFFYKKIAPRFLDIQHRFNIIEGLKTKFVNCELATIFDGTETLVLSDPKVFKAHGRFEKISLDHVSLALKNLAKVHALSFVLEKSQPEFEEIKKICRVDVQYSNVELISSAMLSYYNTSVNVVSDKAAKKRLQDVAQNILKILNKCTMPDSGYNSICHGDFWNNNVLYQYQKTRPVDVIFVDWQLLRYASPVTDISYYLYMSTDHEFRSKYYDHVLSLYYGTLSAVLRQCDLDVNEVYPSSVFEQHLRDYSVYGLIEALISMKIITAETEEALKLIQVKYDHCEEGLCESESPNIPIPLYEERVNGVVNDFFARHYSLDALLSK